MGTSIGATPHKVNVFEQFFERLLAERRLEGFSKDWEKAREKLGAVLLPVPARDPGR